MKFNRNLGLFLTVFIFLIGFASAIWDTNMSVGLKAYWTLNETAGTTAYDSLGIWNATLVNSPSWESGLIGNAINLSGGATNQYINLASGNYTQLISSGRNATSISLWIKPTNFSLDTYTIVFLANVDNISFDPFEGNQFIEYFGDDSHFGFGFRGTSLFVRYNMTFQNLIDQDKFTHIVALYKGGAKTDINNYDLYINGTLYTVGKTMISVGGNDGWNNFLGIDSDGISGDFIGKIDEVGVWNRTLSNTEIISLYNSGDGLSYNSSNITIPPIVPVVPAVPDSGIYNVMASTGAGLAVFIEYMNKGFPILLLGLMLVAIFVIIGSGIKILIKKFSHSHR